jgi:thioredoxin reductase
MNYKIKNTAIIIGGGSSGLYMGKLFEENKISYKIIENFYQVGGQCKNIYPNKYMYDVSGLGKISGEEFTNFLLTFVNKDNIHLNEKYISYEIDKDNHSIIKVITSKNTYCCNYLILSYGIGTGTFNKPIIDDLEIYENKQIFYFPSNPSNIKNKNILIFGGGDTALDAVECLYENNNVSLIHRRDIFKNHEGKNYLLNKINTYIPYSLYKLNSCSEDKNILKSVSIKNNNHILDLEADYVYFCYGYNQDELPEKFIVNFNTMMVQENIFAVGSINNYEKKRNLITTNMYECRIVINEILKNK